MRTEEFIKMLKEVGRIQFDGDSEIVAPPKIRDDLASDLARILPAGDAVSYGIEISALSYQPSESDWTGKLEWLLLIEPGVILRIHAELLKPEEKRSLRIGYEFSPASKLTRAVMVVSGSGTSRGAELTLDFGAHAINAQPENPRIRGLWRFISRLSLERVLGAG